MKLIMIPPRLDITKWDRWVWVSTPREHYSTIYIFYCTAGMCDPHFESYKYVFQYSIRNRQFYDQIICRQGYRILNQ